MLSREDFIFTIGYDGPAAVVDKQAKKKFGKLSSRDLALKGLFRAAYSSAVHSGDNREMEFVANAFKVPEASLDRLFGVSPNPIEVKKAIYI